jgi:hypothetical protein
MSPESGFEGFLVAFTPMEGNKMKLKLVIIAFCLFFAASTALSSSKYYIPQVAVGTFPQNGTLYGYQTTFVLFNNTSANSNVVLTLTTDEGEPLNTTLVDVGTGSTFNLALEPGKTKIIQTNDTGAMRTGAATVASDLDIGISGIFTINDITQGGKFVTEVGVQSLSAANLMSSFVIPVQITADGAINTGLALFSPDFSATLTLSLADVDGTSAGESSVTLDAGEHAAFYLPQKIMGVANTNFSGMLTVQSTAPIAAMVLRQNSPNVFTYTSCPVISTASTQKTFYLARFADGTVGDAQYKTTFMLLNFSNSPAIVTITPYEAATGSSFILTMTNGSTTAGSYTVGAGESMFLNTNSSFNSNKVGSAIITSTVPIGAAALFTQYNADDSFNTETGVQDSPLLSTFTSPVDSQVSLEGSATVDTGFAFLNPNSYYFSFIPRFIDATTGVISTAAKITIKPFAQQAAYFSQMFPQLGNIQGSFFVESGLPPGIAVMTLRMNGSPFNMTTLPAAAGAINLAQTQVPIPDSMKGYELYSWLSNGQWNYTLITGTNREKSPDEIINDADSLTDSWAKLSANSVEGIKQILSRLPANEWVAWWQHTYPAGPFDFPSSQIITEIQTYAKNLGLNFGVANN